MQTLRSKIIISSKTKWSSHVEILSTYEESMTRFICEWFSTKSGTISKSTVKIPSWNKTAYNTQAWKEMIFFKLK